MSLATKIFIKVIALFWAFSVVSYSATIPNFYKTGDEVQKSELSSNPKSIDQKHYMPYSLHVKIKYQLSDITMQKDMASILGFDVMQLVGDFQIDAPFAKYVNGDLLAPDMYGVSRIYEIHYSGTVNPFDICELIEQNPNVEYASPIYIRYSNGFTPDDPRLGEQYALTLMKATEAWEVTKGSDQIVIAIVDSGSDWQHPDLAGNIWINSSEIEDNGIDDDGNGKIDDIRGWDFVGNITTQEYYSGLFRENNNPRNPNNNHGTLSAGCASAVTNNSIGIASLGYSAKIMSLKCASDNASVRGILRGYEAILYAARSGADIINCSWGGPGRSGAEQDVINQATAMGALVVASSGNDNSNNDVFNYYPCNYINVLSVGATDANDRVSGFSNYGHNVNVFAPGSQILSTTIGTGYTRADGTSFSSPIVAGLAALVKSIHPTWSPMQIARQIRSTSDNVLATQNPASRPLIYGRANAEKAVKYNNPDFPELKIPGFYCDAMTVNGNIGAIVNYEMTQVKLNITNYLSPAPNSKIILSPYRDIATLKNNEIEAGDFGQLETKEIIVELQLKENNPWFDGYVDLLVTYQSGDYVDYQMLSIPVKIQSSNKFTLTQALSHTFLITWYGAHTPSKNVFWSVGVAEGQGSILYKVGGSSRFNVFTSEPVYCVYGLSADVAYAGSGPTNGAAKVFKTTDGGANWSTTLVNTITPFINSIHFYDSQNAIFLGDAIGSSWGIASTSNGGANWTKLTNIPNPETGESGYVESVAYHGNSIWFGTSKGRVFRSTNRGQSWDVSVLHVGGTVSKMDFLDDNNGFVVYQEVASGQAGDQFLATTTDGGKTWTKRVQNFTSNSIMPISVYAIRAADKFAITSFNGSVFTSDDMGMTLKPELTKQSTNLQVGTGYGDGASVRLWSAGRISIGFLDFEVTPTNIEKKIAVLNESPVNFGSVDTSTNVIKRVDLRNEGNVRLNFTSFEIIPDEGVDSDEFRLVFNRPEELSPGETVGIAVRFQPKVYQTRTATLRIISDSDPATLDVPLVGIGSTTSSVEDYANYELSITPNPTDEQLTLTHNLSNLTEVQIVDISGKVMISNITGLQSNRLEINVSSMTTGIYYILLRMKNDVIVTKAFVKK
ncbi:MAG: S8 family serine peptidase [Desulfobulbaceae bacterium]|nr:S8 family serine peptidase [Candidatus Kapabacteria bacterium]MBS4000372.1 S8 family serine peptidase [Desulfobulbaceae bacterium]